MDGIQIANNVLIDNGLKVAAQDIEDAVDYNDLSIDEKLEVLVDMEGAPIEFKLALERIRQLENDADAFNIQINDLRIRAQNNWDEAYDEGFRDGQEI